MPKVAIVVPCYNHGEFVAEAVESALAQTHRDLEVVVVDDGSTDPATVRRVAELAQPRVKTLRTANGGLAAARNRGIETTDAEFIVPLDADDRLAPTFVERALAVVAARPSVGIVACEAEYFGLHRGRWPLPPYRFPDVLLEPALCATALFRRADWAAVGGYRTDMRYGYEDHDFWLSLIALGREVHRLPEVLFFYRRTAGGMVAGIDLEKKVYSYLRCYEHHRELYHANMGFLFRRLLELQEERRSRHDPALVQVFAPRAGGHCETASARCHYPAGPWAEIELDLPFDTTGTDGLWRIDPGVTAGGFEIGRVRWIDPLNHRVIHELDGAALQRCSQAAGTALLMPSPGRTLLHSWGTDPQLIVPCAATADPPKVWRVAILLRSALPLADAEEAWARLRAQIQHGGPA